MASPGKPQAEAYLTYLKDKCTSEFEANLSEIVKAAGSQEIAGSPKTVHDLQRRLFETQCALQKAETQRAALENKVRRAESDAKTFEDAFVALEAELGEANEKSMKFEFEKRTQIRRLEMEITNLRCQLHDATDRAPVTTANTRETVHPVTPSKLPATPMGSNELFSPFNDNNIRGNPAGKSYLGRSIQKAQLGTKKDGHQGNSSHECPSLDYVSAGTSESRETDCLFSMEPSPAPSPHDHGTTQSSPQPALFETIREYCGQYALPSSADNGGQADDSELEEHRKEGCRMILMTDLPEGTQVRDVLTRVRGGAIMRCVLADTSPLRGSLTAIITFTSPAGAKAYIEWCDKNEISFTSQDGQSHAVSVKLASGPFEARRGHTSPHTPWVAGNISDRRSRCIRVRDCPPHMIPQIIHDLRVMTPHLRHLVEDAWVDEFGGLNIYFADFSRANDAYHMLINQMAYSSIRQKVLFDADPCADSVTQLRDTPKIASDGFVSQLDLANTAFPVMERPGTDIASAHTPSSSPAELKVDTPANSNSSSGSSHPVSSSPVELDTDSGTTSFHPVSSFSSETTACSPVLEPKQDDAPKETKIHSWTLEEFLAMSSEEWSRWGESSKQRTEGGSSGSGVS